MGTKGLKRIGPAMDRALRWLSNNGGTCRTQQEMALSVGPNGSHPYGVRIITRLADAGLVTIKVYVDPHYRKEITITESGQRRVEAVYGP